MTFGVVGSRSFGNYPYMEAVLVGFLSNITKIVSGGAPGADTLAIEFANSYNIPWKVFPAEWRVNGVYDKSAGYKRNVQIVDASDYLIAFWDGKSKGTKHSIDLATKKGIPFYVYTSWTE
jgi:hypothetical protein